MSYTLQNTIKIIFTFIVLLGSLFFSSSFADNLDKELIQFNLDHSIYSYEYNSGAIILFHPRRGGVTNEFSTKGTSAKYLTTLKQDCVALNGYYFGRGISGDNFQPAGPVTIYRNLVSAPKIIPSTTEPSSDVNLGVNIFYNTLSNTISLGSYIKISKGFSFFAGPMIISDGVSNPDVSKRVSHRSSKHYRTFLVQDNKNKATRGITTEKISLPNLAQALQTIYGNKKISVVNLDGGSSTSFSSSKLSYNESKALPTFFHTCK